MSTSPVLKIPTNKHFLESSQISIPCKMQRSYLTGILIDHTILLRLDVAQTVKSLSAVQETKFEPWVGKIPWRREWLSTPVFLPGEFFQQRSLAGYSPWGHKESDTTE